MGTKFYTSDHLYLSNFDSKEGEISCWEFYISHKGETLCRTSVHWFNQLEDMGIPTHFKEYIPPASMKTKEVRIVYDYSKLNKESTNYLIPLEFIARYYVAGSLFDRLNKGKMSPEDAGFSPDHEVKYGEKLPEPFYEVSTKLEQVDRMLDYDEALEISGLTNEEYDNIIHTIEQIDQLINHSVAERGLIHVDGKKEFALNKIKENVKIVKIRNILH